jgi:hypothetical protein
MRIKVWLRRYLLRWTQKSRAIRQLAQEFDVKESEAFEFVAEIETDSVNTARQSYAARQKYRLDDMWKINQPYIFNHISISEKMIDPLPIVLSAKPFNPLPLDDRPLRPANERTSGARLAS